MKTVSIEYLLIGDKQWSKKEIPLQEYFDDFEQASSIFDAIEKNYLEPRDYVEEAPENIVFLNFTVTDHNNNKIIIKYTYWNNGLSQIMDHSEYINETLEYNTIICSVKIDHENTNLLLRLENINGQLVPLTHSVGEPTSPNFKGFDLSNFKNLR